MQFGGAHGADLAAVEQHAAGIGPAQSEDGTQQYRLAGARAADDAEHLSFEHLHVDAVVHQLLAEAVDHAAHLQQRAHQMSSSMNSTANKASTRITKKIDCTTASVVSRPSSRDDPCTRMPQ